MARPLGIRPQRSITGWRRTGFLKRSLAVSGSIVACGILIMTSAVASGATPEAKKLTSLQKGLNFYKGKTITLICPTAAGSGTDIECRAASVEMASFLQATINVTNIPAGMSIPGQDQTAKSTPNGLTFGIFNIGSDYNNLINNVPGVNFNVERLALIGGIQNDATGLFTQSNSPDPSFSSLFSATPTNPARDLVTAGAAESQAEIAFKVFGINFTFVTGYANSTALATGFLRGDGALESGGNSSLSSELQAGTVHALAEFGQPTEALRGLPYYSEIKSVPDMTQLEKKYPPKTASEKKAERYYNILAKVPGFVFGAPTAVPSDLLQALRAAEKFAARSTYMKTQISAKLGNLSGYVEPTAEKAAYVHALAFVQQIRALLAAR